MRGCAVKYSELGLTYQVYVLLLKASMIFPCTKNVARFLHRAVASISPSILRIFLRIEERLPDGESVECLCRTGPPLAWFSSFASCTASGGLLETIITDHLPFLTFNEQRSVCFDGKSYHEQN